jgi:putative SbcD/Mre11-related phosphoesterase
MTKIERFEAIDRCLFWKQKKILIVGDLHLGYEAYLNERGWTFPKTQVDETIRILKRIFEKTGKLKEVILLGDVKHYFAGVLNMEFRDVYKVVEFIKKNLDKEGKIIIVKGNHDNILDPVIKNYDYVELKDSYVVSDVLFFHGDKESFKRESNNLSRKECRLVVTGHFHPAVNINQDAKSEKYKCFLYGKDKILKKEMIIVPSFFPLVEGSEVDKENNEGRDFSNFNVYAVDDNGKVYGFGKVKGLK